MPKPIDLAGKRFGRLLVEGFHDVARLSTGETKRRWCCLCDCGNKTVVYGSGLTSGNTRSCGCLSREVSRTLHRKHGHSGSREYEIWCGAKKRCYNAKAQMYAYYGGRGIRMCDEWRDDFEAFLRDMGSCPEGMSLDRKDVNGHYEPGNCRWATGVEQANNSRFNRWITYRGERLTIAEATRKYSIHSAPTVLDRLRRGWSVERALLEPLRT